MKFFEAVPSELFSPQASPNRILYADALDVLYAAYQENLKIREDVLYSMLRGRLEQELADATFEDEDIDEEELRDISGRARFLIRKHCCCRRRSLRLRKFRTHRNIHEPGYHRRVGGIIPANGCCN